MSANTRSIGDLFSYGTNAERISLDTKTIPPLFRFFETDTGAQYHWNGSVWVESAFSPSGVSVGNNVALSVADNKDSWSISGDSFVARRFVGPVTGQYGIVQYENPVSSGKVVYVDTLKGEGQPYLLSRGYAMQGTSTALGNISLSCLEGTTPVLQVYGGTVTASPSAYLSYNLTNALVDFPYPILIYPGQHLSFGTVGTNISLGIDITWREIRL